MNEEWLRAFVAFAASMSFTEAARVLHLSQPAVHVQVKKLSESLGTSLYRREGRSLVLTAEGQRVHAFGREQAERTTRFLSELRGRPDDLPVVLSAGAGAYQYLLGKAVRAFTRSGPTPIRLVTHDRAGTVSSVQRGEAHLGVAVVDSVPADVVGERLTDVGAAAVFPRRHVLAQKRALSLKDLHGQRLIVPPEGGPHRVTLNRALLSAGVQWEPAIEASGWDLMMHFARLELGVAVVNGFCEPPAGCVIRAISGLPRVSYQLLYSRARVMDGATRSLRDTILAHVPKLVLDARRTRARSPR